jgi:hypothetical protein
MAKSGPAETEALEVEWGGEGEEVVLESRG